MKSKSIKKRQKFYQNRSKICQNSILEGFGGHLSSFGLPRFVLGPIWTAVGAPLGVVFEAKWGHIGTMLAQKLILGGPGWHSKSTMKFDTLLNRFRTDFGSILGSKMEPKLVQDRSQERS